MLITLGRPLEWQPAITVHINTVHTHRTQCESFALGRALRVHFPLRCWQENEESWTIFVHAAYMCTKRAPETQWNVTVSTSNVARAAPFSVCRQFQISTSISDSKTDNDHYRCNRFIPANFELFIAVIITFIRRKPLVCANFSIRSIANNFCPCGT